MTKVDFTKGERGKYVKRLQAKKEKGLTPAEFKAEVQKYLETGKSDVLTEVEKIKLDAARPAPGVWQRLKNWLKK